MGTARRTSAERGATARPTSRRPTQRPEPPPDAAKAQSANDDAAEFAKTAAAAAAAAASTEFDPMQTWSQWWSMMTPRANASAAPAMAFAPDQLVALQQDYMRALSELWSDFLQHPEKTTAPIKDGRFADPAWQRNPTAALTARAYLLNAQFMNKLADTVQGDKKTRDRVKFAVSQFVDAAAPSNFLALNPQAQQRMLDTKGESLTAGMQNLLGDIGRGKISQSDDKAFEVGRNVAVSEGSVVYENQLIQLIQYKPLTASVHQRPFVMIPPCINKFYILDLQPENSMIRFLVEQGHTVFVASWKNPSEAEQHLTWDDYIELGPIAALRVAREVGGVREVNALGFCVGGTIIVTALAVLAARGERPVASLTLLTALLDFEDSGVLDIFIDESHVRMREKQFGKGGLMPGKDLANTFSSLRANDLVWNYVVSNYLEGRAPPAFDLLYWNGDSTNLPGSMYAWYLRNTYLENSLKIPNKLTVCGAPIDIGRLTMPTFVFAAREDHIVPWRAAYASARALRGVTPDEMKFVLGASGHIAGTINPASKNKRSYWRGKNLQLPKSPDAWLADDVEQTGRCAR